MAELTDRCERCGSLNIRGALHCDACGKAFSANFAAKYEEYTKKSRNFFILFIGSVILFGVLTVGFSESSTLPSVFRYILMCLLPLSFCSVAYSLCRGISFFFGRNKYKHCEDIEFTESSLAGNPEDEAQAGSYGVKCLSCGSLLSKKDTRCKFCGYDLSNATGPAQSRLSDDELVKGINDYEKRGWKYVILSVLVLLTGILTFCMGGQRFSVFTIVGVVIIIAFFAVFAMGVGFLSMADKMFKVNVVRDALASIIDDCVYRSDESISKERIGATNLVEGWNKFHGNDYIRGTYKGRQFEFSDILLENEHSDGKDGTRSDTIFRGHWLIYKFAKTLPAIIRLSEGAGKCNAETDNTAFNKEYKIYTDDPHYMFYVLTPRFMEYIISAGAAANARTFYYFAGDTVHIAVYNRRNIFEIQSADKNNPDMARERIKSEMRSITGILDELLQNEYLFDEG